MSPWVADERCEQKNISIRFKRLHFSQAGLGCCDIPLQFIWHFWTTDLLLTIAESKKAKFKMHKTLYLFSENTYTLNVLVLFLCVWFRRCQQKFKCFMSVKMVGNEQAAAAVLSSCLSALAPWSPIREESL